MLAKREETRDSIYGAIKLAAEEIAAKGATAASSTAELEALARAYRAVYGGSQPGGGCNCGGSGSKGK